MEFINEFTESVEKWNLSMSLLSQLRNGILFSIPNNLWTRMERGILVPKKKHAPFRHFSYFLVLKISDFRKQKKFSHPSRPLTNS